MYIGSCIVSLFVCVLHVVCAHVVLLACLLACSLACLLCLMFIPVTTPLSYWKEDSNIPFLSLISFPSPLKPDCGFA